VGHPSGRPEAKVSAIGGARAPPKSPSVHFHANTSGNGFDGIDIDYEHPTTNNEAGNPLDFGMSKPRLAGLMKSYNVLLERVPEKLDTAAVADKKYYLLTIAGSASAWILRGEENLSGLKYLDNYPINPVMTVTPAELAIAGAGRIDGDHAELPPADQRPVGLRDYRGRRAPCAGR
jgi:hypothetical protein